MLTNDNVYILDLVAKVVSCMLIYFESRMTVKLVTKLALSAIIQIEY